MGLVGLLAWPAAVGASRYSDRVDLIEALIGAVPVGIVFGLGAIFFARRARRRIQRTVGRSGRGRTAVAGRALGLFAICVAITGGLALGFFGLLQLFAS